jgi:hypothetical protein
MPDANSLRERLFSQLVTDPSGCLLWTGRCFPNGYGQIRINGRTELVHRVMYRMFEDEIPDGMKLDHVKALGCLYRHCASLAHLEPVTNRENLLRGETVAAAHAAATHCPQGHEYDLLNTYWTPDGRRNCRSCRSAARRRSSDRQKAAK